MLRGTIKHVNPRGFGFIIPDGGAHDYFFHMTALVAVAFDQLREGQRVEFEVANDPQNRNRRRAAQVRCIENDAPYTPPPDTSTIAEELPPGK